ncbi:MAG: YARHG domain-containing protein [Lachnospiraceae bacterium]|nr:YARHG domain-containing protein [Lachnospiraceae bacterium]
MFCNKCGAEISEGYAFCSKCGAPVQKMHPVHSAQNAEPVQPEKPTGNSGSIGKIIVIASAVLIAAVILAAGGYFFYTRSVGADDDRDDKKTEKTAEVSEDEDAGEAEAPDGGEDEGAAVSDDAEAETADSPEENVQDEEKTDEDLLKEYMDSLDMISFDRLKMDYVERNMGDYKYYERGEFPVDTGYLYTTLGECDGAPVVYSLYAEGRPYEDDPDNRYYEAVQFEAAYVRGREIKKEYCDLGVLAPNGDSSSVGIYLKDDTVICYCIGDSYVASDGEFINLTICSFDGNRWLPIIDEGNAGSDLESDNGSFVQQFDAARAYESIGLVNSAEHARNSYYMNVEEEADDLRPVYVLNAINDFDYESGIAPVVTFKEFPVEMARKPREMTVYDEYSSYILPDSDSRYYTEAELRSLTDDELRLARNELYARHGRKFKSKDLQDHFDSKDWYVPIYGADEFDRIQNDILNDYEIANRDLIVKVEGSR